jgi:hypothetical protein
MSLQLPCCVSIDAVGAALVQPATAAATALGAPGEEPETDESQGENENNEKFSHSIHSSL